MSKQTPFILASLLLAISCGKGGESSGGPGFDPKTEHSPDVPTYSSGNTSWTPDASVTNPNEVTVVNGATIVAKKNAVIAQFQNGSVIIAGGVDTSGTTTATAQMISSGGVVSSANALQEAVSDSGNTMVVPLHAGMTNELYVVGGVKSNGSYSGKVQKYSNAGVKTDLTDLFFGIAKTEMSYNSYAIAWMGGKWEAWEDNSRTPEGIAVMNLSNQGYWSAFQGSDLDRTPVYEMSGHKVAIANGESYSVGGKYSAKNIYMVDVSSQLWHSVGTLQVAVQAGQDVLGKSASGVLTVIGGAVVGADCTTAVQVYDLNTESQTSTNMNIGRCGHSSLELAADQIIVVGGRKSYSENSERTNSIEMFNPNTGTWRVVGKLSQGRSGHKIFKRGANQIVVVGGTDASGTPIAQTETITY